MAIMSLATANGPTDSSKLTTPVGTERRPKLPRAWLTIPSVRNESDSTLRCWREKGYGVALFRDVGSPPVQADLIRRGLYRGYAVEVNALVADVLARDPECDFVIPAGDDIQPDLAHSPAEIADSLISHFGGTFGVCQPVGDRWADRQGPMSERVAGSAWCGREFCKRANRGTGPLWHEYFHYCVDEELQEVATRLGIFWQRPDII